MMRRKNKEASERVNDVRAAAVEACLKIFGPLIEFASYAGLHAIELNSIIRQSAVEAIASRQRLFDRRVSISGIAALTGIPRSEISQILKTKQKRNLPPLGRQPPVIRIVSAWHRERRYIDSDGLPRDLKMYGRGTTFESLVREYGGGIPPRAMLDELVRSGAIEIASRQTLRTKASSIRGVATADTIKVFGNRASELLATMLSSVRNEDGLPDRPKNCPTPGRVGIQASIGKRQNFRRKT